MEKNKAVKILTYFYLIPFAVIVAFSILNSLFRTTYFDLYQFIESAKYKWDHPGLLIIATGLILGVMYLTGKIRWFNKKNLTQFALLWAGFVSLGSVLLFRCIAKCDSAFLSEIAIQFMQNNYQTFEQGGYLYMYPFQLGFTAVMEMIYRMFGIENYIVFELINIVCVVDMIWILGRITGELFEEEQTYKIEMLLSMGMLPLFLLTTFIYGDIPGWCMGIHAIYLIIRYLKTDRWQEILKASIWLALGIIMKSNLNIMVVAAAIVLILHAIEKKNAKILLWIVELVVVSQLGMMIVNGIYTVRVGEDLPEGIPKIAWVAMGMQESPEGEAAAGWYNGYNWDVYATNGYDKDLTVQAAIEDLKASLGGMIKEPRRALAFIYDKFTSQWNDPTFMSLLTNEWYSRNVEPQSRVAIYFLYEGGRTILSFIMNIYHFIIFLGVGMFCFLDFKKWRLDKSYLILNIFGGMLFHMLWEAKARYVLFYFILLLPLTAAGYNNFINKIREITDKTGYFFKKNE